MTYRTEDALVKYLKDFKECQIGLYDKLNYLEARVDKIRKKQYRYTVNE